MGVYSVWRERDRKRAEANERAPETTIADVLPSEQTAVDAVLTPVSAVDGATPVEPIEPARRGRKAR